MQSIILVTCLLVTPLVRASDNPSSVLIELRNQAVEKNFELLTSKSSLTAKQAERDEGWRLVWPQFDFVSSAGSRKANVLSGTAPYDGQAYNVYAHSLQANWTLIRGGAVWSKLSALEAEVDVADIEYRRLLGELENKLIVLGVSIASEQRHVETLTGLKAALTKMIGVTRLREARGTERKSTLLQLEVQMDRLDANLENLKNSLSLKALELAEIVQHGDEQFELPQFQLAGDKLESYGRNLLERVRKIPTTSLNSSYEIQKQEKLFEISQKNKIVNLAEHWPSLQTFANWGTTANRWSDTLRRDAVEWNVGVELRIPLFSGLSSFKDRVVQAQLVQNSKLALEKLRLSHHRQWVQRLLDLESQLRLLQINQRALTKSKLSYTEAQADYARGLNSYLAVFESQRNVIDSEINWLQMRTLIVQTLVEIYRLQGRSSFEILNAL